MTEAIKVPEQRVVQEGLELGPAERAEAAQFFARRFRRNASALGLPDPDGTAQAVMALLRIEGNLLLLPRFSALTRRGRKILDFLLGFNGLALGMPPGAPGPRPAPDGAPAGSVGHGPGEERLDLSCLEAFRLIGEQECAKAYPGAEGLAADFGAAFAAEQAVDLGAARLFAVSFAGEEWWASFGVLARYVASRTAALLPVEVMRCSRYEAS